MGTNPINEKQIESNGGYNSHKWKKIQKNLKVAVLQVTIIV